MIYEYLIFNLLVISGPLILGSLKPFYFLPHWPRVIFSALLVGIPYLVWDSLVAGSHWEFNYQYIFGLTVFNLPLEEILFFFTVPAACLFSWEMIVRRMDGRQISWLKNVRTVSLLLPVAGVMIYLNGQRYTGLATVFLGLAVWLDLFLKTNLFLQKRFVFYFLLVMFFTLIFNGYLTWRPVVVYNENFLSGWRIFTIPAEDFWYGFSLIYLNTIVFQKLKDVKILSTNQISITAN
jgi:lycopene cyclase domain-containing protein